MSRKFAALPLLALALLAPELALANPATPPNNIPSMADWEQLLLQNLTGPDGVPLALGTPPVLSGTCATGTQLGGQATGSFKASAACSAGTVILTFLNAAPNGFECGAKDLTTVADVLTPSAYTPTSFTFSPVTMVSGDQAIFSCRAF
jgi:hypothetical protein